VAVQFSQLSRWGLERNALVQKVPNGWRILKLRELLQQVDVRTRVKGDQEYRLCGVKWYGEGVFERETCLGSELSASQLYPLVEGRLIYNRLFAWKSSFALVPPECDGLFVSNEFPQFAVDANLALAEYVRLYCLSDAFIAAVKKASEGSAAVSRNRFKESSFLGFEIPLPPLEIQRAIVTQWQKLQAQCSAIEITAATADQMTRPIVWTALGLSDPTATQAKPRTFAMNWSDIDRWGIDQIWQSRQVTATPTYPLHRIADLCRMGSGGTPSRAIASYFDGGDIPWVKTTEVRGEVITETEEKITKAALKNSSAKLYPAGSLLIAMYGQGATRGRTAKLGIEAATNQACCALYDFVPEVLPDFLWYFLMAEYDRLRAMASGNNQPNLNAEMIANYRVPLPPLSVQQTLITAIGQARSDALALRQQAKQLREQAKREIEAALLGQALLSI
jgi:type I restriction enzyme S subunit